MFGLETLPTIIHHAEQLHIHHLKMPLKMPLPEV